MAQNCCAPARVRRHPEILYLSRETARIPSMTDVSVTQPAHDQRRLNTRPQRRDITRQVR